MARARFHVTRRVQVVDRDSVPRVVDSQANQIRVMARVTGRALAVTLRASATGLPVAVRVTGH
eukprot:1083425-Rhodomonas_salina.2